MWTLAGIPVLATNVISVTEHEEVERSSMTIRFNYVSIIPCEQQSVFSSTLRMVAECDIHYQITQLHISEHPAAETPTDFAMSTCLPACKNFKTAIEPKLNF
jgi:hypothetical protein